MLHDATCHEPASVPIIDQNTGLPASRRRGHWVRLRTLMVLRWIAICGQLIAITTASRVFEVQLDLGLCYLAVGASVLANLIAAFIYPETKRLSETETMLTQLFDISQIAFLLYLTGGLNNPFALLIIAPVTISATALEWRATAFLGVVAAALLSVLYFFHLPLILADGTQLLLPPIYIFGVWSAILIGMCFLAAYAHRITEETHSMADALAATQMALAREQKLTDLGGVIAAAAHELGTPLATIKLVSSELVDELHMHSAPLDTLLREAAEPHLDRGRDVHFEISPMPEADLRQPLVLRRPEIIHGLRNLIQNAVDFAANTVWINAEWTDKTVTVRIADDGRGFPASLMNRIGDPFMTRRPASRDDPQRPGYRGMGLGLFIAKTLLERSGAALDFANGTDPFLTHAERPKQCGAVIEVTWPRSAIVSDAGGLGENRPIEG